ncbi:hypothetical protein ACWDUI_21785, partial [Streptosporangium sandarakinum]
MSTIVDNRYKLASPVGRGATGVVWRAYDMLLDREVALKEIPLPPGPDAVERRRRVVPSGVPRLDRLPDREQRLGQRRA